MIDNLEAADELQNLCQLMRDILSVSGYHAIYLVVSFYIGFTGTNSGTSLLSVLLQLMLLDIDIVYR